MRRILECTGALLLCGLLPAAARAGERILLASGFEIHADHHETAGDIVKVFSGSGITELPATSIAEFQQEEYAAPAVAAASQAPEPPAVKPATPRDFIQAAVNRHNLPKELLSLVESVIRQESGFRASAVSPKGAIGLMQLMPGTARALGADPRDPEQNVDAGTRYLTALLEKYENRDDQVIRALAAYNAGPGAVDKYNGVPPYRETREYVRRVVRNYLKDQNKPGSR